MLLLAICTITISLTTATKLNEGALPFTCGDGSSFGAPYNCNIPPAYPKDRRKNENSLRIMQFNADSLFLEGCAAWNKFDPRNPAAKTGVGAMSHLQTIANVIYKLNADIIFIDEVCDCCVLRELIRHMNRNHLAQTYQEYLLQSDEENGELIGIITRIDPIDLWNVNSTPKVIKSKHTSKSLRQMDREKAKENELPPPPLPMDNNRRRRMINGRATKKRQSKTPKAYNPGPLKEKKSGTKGLKAPPKPLDKNGNKIVAKKKTVKGLKPPPPPLKGKPKMIREKEYQKKPRGTMKHLAASFNVHLDKPLCVIGAQFADFSENNQRLRRSQAKDLARFVNLYQKDYHIIVVGDFQSVPEGEVLKRFGEDTGFKNIGYKYFDRDDFTYLSQLSMGMLDNIFTSQPMYQKIQDTKIDYSHRRPIFPYSNHLPIMIDIDTTWYGGWGSRRLDPPPFKSIRADEGEQKKEPSQTGYIDANTGEQSDQDHSSYKRDMPQLIQKGPMVNVPAQDQMPEPPMPVMKGGMEYEDVYGYGYENIDAFDEEYDERYEDYSDGYEEEEENERVMDKARYRSEREIIEDESVLNQSWLQSVLKWMIYGLVGTVCMCVGLCFGYFFVGFWKSYKGRVVHVSRF